MPRYAEAEDYAKLFCGEWPTTAPVTAAIERALDITSGRILLALASVGADSCPLSTGGTDALKLLNCLLAALFHDCPCGGALEDDVRISIGEQVTEMLTALGNGVLEVCQGETGTNFPVFEWAEQGLTVWNEARIIYNNRLP